MSRSADRFYPPTFFVLLIIALSTFLPSIVVEGVGSLQEKWKIDGPCSTKWNDDFPICPSLATSEGGHDDNLHDDNVATVKTGIDYVELRADCANTRKGTGSCSIPTAFQLTYGVHRHPKTIKYRIFQKGCLHEFEGGNFPLVGSGGLDSHGDDVTGPYYVVTPRQLDADDTSNQTVAIEFIPTEMGEKQDRIEFCIRMGLWLPPEAGGLEVSFRQTNVVVTFAHNEQFDRIVQSVELDPLPLVAVTLNVFGSANNPSLQAVDESEKQ